MNDRFSINGDNALPHAVLWQSYAVEEVAKIAATFARGSNQERVVNALKLIEAVENMANEDFVGFLEFVKFPEAKPKYVPTLPPVRGDDGAFAKPDRGADGKMKPIRDVSNAEEARTPALPIGEDERAEKKVWKKR